MEITKVESNFTVTETRTYKRHMTSQEATALARRLGLSSKVTEFITKKFVTAEKWRKEQLELYPNDFDIECNVGDNGRLGLGMGWEGEWDGLSEAMDISPIPREAGDPGYLEVDKVFSLFFQE